MITGFVLISLSILIRPSIHLLILFQIYQLTLETIVTMLGVLLNMKVMTVHLSKVQI